MSHYVKLKATYRDKAALVAALERCGVPKDAISVAEKESTVRVNHAKIDAYNDIVFTVATKPGEESSVQIDPYAWTRTSLKGLEGKHESGSWLNRVSMEYRAEVEIRKAKALCRTFQRVDTPDKILVYVK